jgi:hypothetical protein
MFWAKQIQSMSPIPFSEALHLICNNLNEHKPVNQEMEEKYFNRHLETYVRLRHRWEENIKLQLEDSHQD